MVIGITGGSGCGKTTALDVLKEFGFTTLDADAIYHELLRTDGELLNSIEDAFPGSVENGVLQRKKLGAVVFADPEKLKLLGRITHPAVYREIESRLHGQNAVIDAFGLREGGLDRLCDHTVAVLAPREARIARLMARDGISREYAESRLSAQKSDEAFSSECEYTLLNNGSREEFVQRCRAFFTRLIG